MPPAPEGKSADEIIVYALSHPIRVGALRIFNEREASIAEVARELREDAKKVGNHVKALLEHGCIQWTRTQRSRGAEEHFYRVSARCREISPEEWVRLAPEDRLRISANDFVAAVAEGLAAFRTGKLDSRLDRHLSQQTAEVDEPAWSEVTLLLEETAKRVAEIVDAAARRVSPAKPGVPLLVALLGAERATSYRGTASRLALPHSEE
jgi:predicted ArsR family transcriptional regulator